MSAAIQRLPVAAVEGHPPSGYGDESHPMRVMTRRIAGLSPGGWDATARCEVADLFDSLAPEWHTRGSPERTAVVADAFERGGLGDGPRELAAEVGSGIGAYSGMVAERFASTLAVELALGMARRAPAGPAHRVLADGGSLPAPDRSVDAVVLVNTFLFLAEVDRILRPGGALAWVNTSGEQTPIHLTTAEVVEALPFTVTGVESRAGAGTWCVLRRSG